MNTELFQVLLFGSPQIFVEQKPLPPFPTQKCRELFAYLALQPNRQHARLVLAGHLWPDKTEDKARASLSTELWRLKRVLGKYQFCLELARDEIQLNIPIECMDIHEFVKAFKHSDYESLRLCEKLYRADFMEGCYTDWCMMERERLFGLFLSTLEHLLRYHEARGEWQDAISIAKRLISYDVLREDLHRNLMRLYVAAGDRAAALTQYHICKEILKRELKIEPLPETQELFRHISLVHPSEDFWMDRFEETRKLAFQRLTDLRQTGQYLSELFAARTNLDSILEEFEASPSIALMLSGASGCGKTTWLAHFAETRLVQGDMVLFYNAASVTLDFSNMVARHVWGSNMVTATEALLGLGREASRNKKRIWLLIDNIGSFHDLGANPSDLLRRINELASDLQVRFEGKPQIPVHIIATCRDHAWQMMTLGNQSLMDWSCYYKQQLVVLENFSADELRNAFAVSREHYDLKGTFDELTEYMRQEMEYPLTLRMLSEICRGRSIVRDLRGVALFKQYLEQKVNLLTTRQFLAELVRWLAENHADRISFVKLMAEGTLNWGMGEHIEAPFQQLTDLGILVINAEEPHAVVRIGHDRLFEYLLAQYYLSRQNAGGVIPDLANLAQKSDEYPALWGTVIMMLVIRRQEDDFLSLARSASPLTREITIEGLTILHEEEPALALLFVGKILNLDSTDAKRLALRAAWNMGADGYDLFFSTLDSGSESTRRITLALLNLTWRTNPSLMLALLRKLIAEVSGQTIITSPARIQTLTRILGWFFAYDLPQNDLRELDDLAYELAVNKLGLPSQESKSRMWPLLKKVMAFNSSSWPSRQDTLEEVADLERITTEERDSFGRVLFALRSSNTDITEERLDDVRILLQSQWDFLHYPAHHLLAIWIHLQPNRCIPLLHALFDALEGDGRLWLLMAFYPLSVPTQAEFSRDHLSALEELTARMAEENDAIFRHGVKRGVLADLGSVAFLSLAMRYLRAGEIKFPLLSSLYLASQEKDGRQGASYLRLLTPVGLIHPKEAMQFLDTVTDWTLPIDEPTAQTLGLIRSLHPETIDAMLFQRRVSEGDQHRICLVADINQATYQASIIRSQDTRVCSILLGSPYGRWLTDWVMHGYLEAKTPRALAQRFGEGLFDSLRESNWHLMRLYGLD